jgi:hypothetical protein
MSLFTHDPNLYLSIPTRTPAASMSLARALLGAAPIAVEVVVGKRLSTMHAKASTLQSVWTAVNRPDNNPEGAREYDIALDHEWTVVYSRLLHWVDGKRDGDEDDEPDRAAKLVALLFPTGLDFLRLPYTEQWAESERRIVLIDIDKLEADLGDLIDARNVARLRKAHAEYGRVLGITHKKVTVDSGRVIDAMRELRLEMVGLARLVLGLTDENDPVGVAAAEAQLEPILRYRKPRSAIAAQGSEAEADVEVGEDETEPVDAPLPSVPVSAA